MLKTPIIPFRKANLWGVCNPKQDMVVECQFDFAFSPVQDADESWLILVKDAQQRYGWVWWKEGNVVIVQPSYYLDILEWFGDAYQEDSPTKRPLQVDHEFIPVLTENAGWGYINRLGEEVVAPMYAEARYFFGGAAVASVSTQFNVKKWGLIDYQGRWLVQPIYSYLSSSYDGLRIFKEHIKGLGDRFGYLDNQTKQEVIAAQFDKAAGFVDGLAVVKCKKMALNVMVINRQGDIVMDQLSDAKCGCAGVIAVCNGKKWGVINQQGQQVLPFNFSEAGLPSDAMMGLKKGRKWAIYEVKSTGEVTQIVAPTYPWMVEYSHGYAWVMDERHQSFYIDRSGIAVELEQKSDVPEKFYYNRCLVMSYHDNLHGYIDQHGKLAIARKYKLANHFEFSGLASVVTCNHGGIKEGYGYIDACGHEYWQD